MSNKTVSAALSRAQRFEEEGQEQKAFECYKEAFEINQADTDVLQKLAISAQVLGLNQEAILYWNYYMQLKPEDALSYTQLLDLYFHDSKYMYYLTRAKLKTLEGRLQQATDDYKKAISNTTEEKEIVSARYLLAQSFEILNKNPQAIDEYLKILDYDHNEAVYLSLAGLYYLEDKSAALDLLMRAVAEYPESEPIKESLCKVFLALGDYENAEKYAVSKFNKIKSMLMQDKNSSAYELIQTLSDAEKQDISYPALMAEYYYNISDSENALIWISTIEKMSPDNPLSSQMRALVYEKIDDEFNSHLNWGKYYSKKGQYDLAQDEYLQAYNINNSDIEVIRELINHYSVIDDKFACAEFCEKLVAVDKNDNATIKRLVKFYDEQGYEDKVVDYLTKLVENNPRDYESILKLARHAQKLRRYDEAIDLYQKYLKFAPNSDEKELAQKQLNALTTGEMQDEEGVLDKILKFFSRKN